MAAKKAAKKAFKKAAKKGAKHAHDKHHAGKDIRRAYEHLGRLEILRGSLTHSVAARVETLISLAQASLLRGDAKSAADLLRAGEHWSFGSLASAAKETRISDELEEAIVAEYEHLREKADDHRSRHEEEYAAELDPLYKEAKDAAEAALAKNAYRKALEFARAAEALAHVHPGALELGPGIKERGLLKN